MSHHRCCCGSGEPSCECSLNGPELAFADCRLATGFEGRPWAPGAFKNLGPKAIGTACSGPNNDVPEYRSYVDIAAFTFSQTTRRQWSWELDDGFSYDESDTQTLSITVPAFRMYASPVPYGVEWLAGDLFWLTKLYYGVFHVDTYFNTLGSYLYRPARVPGCPPDPIQLSITASDFGYGRYLRADGSMVKTGGTYDDRNGGVGTGLMQLTLGYMTRQQDEHLVNRVHPVLRIAGTIPSLEDGNPIGVDVILHRKPDYQGGTDPYLDQNSVGVPKTFSGVSWMARHFRTEAVATNYWAPRSLNHHPLLNERQGDGDQDWQMTLGNPCPQNLLGGGPDPNTAAIEASQAADPLHRCTTCGG